MSDPDPSGARSITILRCTGRGKRATKRWRADPITGEPRREDFDAGTWFKAARCAFTNIHELSALLTRLESDPLALVIRGKPCDGVDLSQPVRRRKTPDKAGKRWFEDEPGGLHWVLLDFDKVRLPAGLDPVTEPEETVRWLVSLLPDEFQGITFH